MKGAVLTIGNFDGVHLGHKKLVNAVVQTARAQNRPSVLYTFSPHPAVVLFPQKKHFFLYPIQQNRERLLTLGLDHLIVKPFTRAFSRLSPEEFIKKHIVERFQPAQIVVGHDFRFGADGKGTARLLKKLGEKYNFKTKVLLPVRRKGVIVSSSAVKTAILSGQWDLARALLGRFFSIKAQVVKGEGRGKHIGFPTLNLKGHKNTTLPARGVYTARVKKKDQYFPAVVNIGVSPTFSQTGPQKIEVHLIGQTRPWREKSCEVELLRYIRPERHFASAQALARQIKKDIDTARRCLSRVPVGK